MRVPESLVFIKSSFSTSGDCVQWAFTQDGVFLRDSKQPDGFVFVLTNSEWMTFTQSVSAGEPHFGHIVWRRDSQGVSIFAADAPAEELRFADSEWSAFTAAILNREVYEHLSRMP